MLKSILQRRIVAKLKQHLRSLKSQKWLMEIMQSILIDFIKDYFKDCIKNVCADINEKLIYFAKC